MSKTVVLCGLQRKKSKSRILFSDTVKRGIVKPKSVYKTQSEAKETETSV